MRAIRVERFGGTDVLQVADIAPPVPARGQVLVRMHAAGVNPVDTYIRAGQYAKLPALPYTPGVDGAGLVEAVGADVADLRVGERVYIISSASGTSAELAVADAVQVYPLPDNVTFAQGAAVGIPYTTAYRAMFLRAQAQPGETVLVHGATGAVGLAAVQLARAAGLRVIATGGSAAGRARVVAQGAALVLDHHAEDIGPAVLLATGGRGVDVIVELLANVNLGRDLPLLAAGGRIAVVGSRGTVEINPRDLMAREAAVFGVMLWQATAAEIARSQAAIHAGLVAGTLQPVVGGEFPLEQVAQAHERVLQPGALGKLVLIP
ncbi:MAG: NADPH:quinone reductase [Nevskiaceae bacterium]|nr:MAG: NADPH:quinone reductase [Nevskiaceae bacterium]TBR73121.1 MAG: NADPH:quinone reductase [Nevskiaceae bacterium]